MRNNSIQRDGVVKKNKLKKKQIKIAKTVILLAVLGALVGVGAVNEYNKEQDEKYAIIRVDSLDDFDYAKRWGRTEKYYDEMVDSIILNYYKLSQLPDVNYKLMGIYKAHDGFIRVYGKDKTLMGMESLFGKIKNKVFDENLDVDLRDVVKADSNDKYFYLDFVYDTLKRAGYEELNSEKYQSLLTKYKYANFGNYYGVVGVILTENENELLADIMNKYVEYYRGVKLDLGYMMESGEYSFYDTYTESVEKGR